MYLFTRIFKIPLLSVVVVSNVIVLKSIDFLLIFVQIITVFTNN